MHKQLEVLVVSCRTENRKSSLFVFEGLPINAYCASTIEQAREFLASHSVPWSFAKNGYPTAPIALCFPPFGL
jgi:hypothetical protein